MGYRDTFEVYNPIVLAVGCGFTAIGIGVLVSLIQSGGGWPMLVFGSIFGATVLLGAAVVRAQLRAKRNPRT